MSAYAGKDGVIKVAGTACGEVKNWTLNVQAEFGEVKSKGTDWKRQVIGHKGWSGSLSCNSDFGDAQQQALYTALGSGADIELVLFGAGEAVGKKYTGNAKITSCALASPDSPDAADRTFEFVGNGAITEANVS